MKSIFLRYLMLIALIFGMGKAYSQCTPGNEETCPDPEGNGQMCPEILNPVFVGLEYKQEVTILAPVQLDTLNLQIPVHHLTLIDVQNLPEGIDWVSNAENDEFFAGIYYCMLLSGTTNAEPALYPLKIIIDVYADVQGVGVKVAQLTDSTTLSLNVEWNPNGLGELAANQLISRMWPNPVSDYLNLEMQASISGNIEIELFDMMGNSIFLQAFEKPNDNPFISIDLSTVRSGAYLISVKNNGKLHTRPLVIAKK